MGRLRTEKLKIIGMHCVSCANTIEKKLRSLNGVVDAKVSFVGEEAVVVYDQEKILLKDIVRAIRDIGYDVYKEEAYLVIQNISSVDDESIIEDRVCSMPGVIDVKASHVVRSVSVTFNPLTTSIDDIRNAIESLGYRIAGIKAEIEVEDVERTILRREVARLKKVVTACLILALTLATYMMMGVFGIPMPYWEYRSVIGFVLSTPVVFIGGKRFFVGAYKALKNKSAGMDTLVSLGTGAAYLFSLAVMAGLIESPETYFEASAVVIAFVLLGRYLELRMKVRTGEAVRRLMELQARRARVVRNGREVEVPIEEVKVKDIVVVKPGEKIPVDGIVVEGQGYVDESMITGEPIPVFKKNRSPVIAGTILKSGSLKIIATRVGRETVLAQIIKLVRHAQMGKPPIQRLVDRIAGYFAWVVIAIAVLTFSFWYFIAGVPLHLAVVFTASVLLVACPCALGLATPTAIVVGVGKAAEHGVIIKNIEVIEVIPRLKTIVFDKTGTLTKGEPEVTDVYPVNGFKTADLLKIAYVAEKRSEHPLAQAITRKAREVISSDEQGIEPEFFDSIPGQGVIAKFSGRTIVVGNEKLMKAYNVRLEPVSRVAEKLREEGKTVVYVAVDGVIAGVIAIADTPREHAKQVISYLKKRGFKVVMLTGDNRRTAKAIAEKLGIDEVIAEVLPEDKADVIKSLQKNGEVVAMVGDGINDAPSLTQADIGIAMGGGTDIAKEAGDMILVRNDLRGVTVSLEISRAIRRKVVFNLFWAFIYNTILIPVAAGLLYPFTGIVFRPEFAGIAMALSSISVTGNALTLKKWRPPEIT